ncbi:TadE/TadG family type IV pilus assembly protein [Marinobacterium jannaschii]|uniref:TadE/TadG family type IV pilus assembly protein n=1 Tax=Marinobacterium jannaschii TaxID=64970 RepID=UPI000A6EC070|nr:pilus assembly protein TadG-related protein [Marinobacterium jannaschii]
MSGSARKRQSGLYVTTAVVLAAMLGMATYTLEGSQLMLSRSRLQFLVDAAALSAAKVLHDTAGNQSLARRRAISTFERNLQSEGNQTLYKAWQRKELSLKVDFSDQLAPFSPVSASTATERYFVRIAVLERSSGEWISSAVAGPSAGLDKQVCGVSPILICGCTPGETGCAKDSYLGLNYQAGNHAAGNINRLSSARGQALGGYQLLAQAAGHNTQGIKRALDQGYNQCLKVGDKVELYRGDRVRPVAASIANRFTPRGITSAYSLPDLVSLTRSGSATELPDFDYAGYRHYTARCMADPSLAGCNAQGLAGRREMIMPVAACGATEGAKAEARILGFACAFLLQPVQRQSGHAQLDIELVKGCLGQGGSSVGSAPGPQPSRIVLYLDGDRGGAG